MFSLYPLGVNGLYSDLNSPSSGYLLSFDDKKLLVDVGSGVFPKLLEKIKPENLEGIIISHFHFDHVSDLGVLSYYLQSKNARLKVYCPKDGSNLYNAFYQSPYLDFIEIKEGQNLLLNGLSVDFYKMNHPVYTLGASFSYKGRKLVYTADTNQCDSLDLMSRDANLILADSAFLHSEWSKDRPHLSAMLCALLGKTNKSKVLLTHINPKGDKAKYLSEALSCWSDCQIAESKEYMI